MKKVHWTGPKPLLQVGCGLPAPGATGLVTTVGSPSQHQDLFFEDDNETYLHQISFERLTPTTLELLASIELIFQNGLIKPGLNHPALAYKVFASSLYYLHSINYIELQ